MGKGKYLLPPKINNKIRREVEHLLSQGYELIINKEVEVAKGCQYFGSGGYVASYQVLVGSIKVLSERCIDNGFIFVRYQRIKAISIPTIVRCVECDSIGRLDQIPRYFKRFVAIWY